MPELCLCQDKSALKAERSVVCQLGWWASSKPSALSQHMPVLPFHCCQMTCLRCGISDGEPDLCGFDAVIDLWKILPAKACNLKTQLQDCFEGIFGPSPRFGCSSLCFNFKLICIVYSFYFWFPFGFISIFKKASLECVLFWTLCCEVCCWKIMAKGCEVLGV